MQCHDTNIRTSHNKNSKNVTDIVYDVTTPGSGHGTPETIMQITNVVYDVRIPDSGHVTPETIIV